MGRLDGKVALISGAARGMGNAEAKLFAAEGAKVVLGDVIDDEGKAVAKEIGASAIYQRLDVTQEEAWAAATRLALESFGRLDILVNNAGIVEPAPFAVMKLDSYRRVTEVNQTGVFIGMQAAIEPMTAAGGGSIINISSIDGMIGMNLVMSYIASKWAVRGMTKAAALELASRGIRVNSIHPGFIHTQLGNPNAGPESREALDAYSAAEVPLRRTGEPIDIAHMALFLASDESSFCTGSEFTADGGLIAGRALPGTSLID